MIAESWSAPTPLGPGEAAAIESLYATGHWLVSEDRHVDAAVVFRLLLRAAPTDERSWLALGECHERLGQVDVALELYGGGIVAAEPAVRCALARVRALQSADRPEEADDAYDRAVSLAQELGDEELIALVDTARRGRS